MTADQTRELIANGVDVNAKNSPLHRMYKEGAVRVLIEAGADVDARDAKECTPLHWIKEDGAVRALIEAGADVNARDIHGHTPLHNRIIPEGAVRALIKAGADVNAICGWGLTPLFYQDGGSVRALLEAGADITITLKGDVNYNPLHWLKNEEGARALIEAGVDVNARDKFGYAPLHHQKAGGTVRALIEAGADVNARDKTGLTPLHWILSVSKDVGAVRALIKAGADVNARDNRGDTPLHHQKREGAVRALIKAGADINAENNRFITPFYIPRDTYNRKDEKAYAALIEARDSHIPPPHVHIVTSDFKSELAQITLADHLDRDVNVLCRAFLQFADGPNTPESEESDWDHSWSPEWIGDWNHDHIVKRDIQHWRDSKYRKHLKYSTHRKYLIPSYLCLHMNKEQRAREEELAGIAKCKMFMIYIRLRINIAWSIADLIELCLFHNYRDITHKLLNDAKYTRLDCISDVMGHLLLDLLNNPFLVKYDRSVRKIKCARVSRGLRILTLLSKMWV